MMAQEFIHWDPTKPHNERYLQQPDYLSPAETERVVADAIDAVVFRRLWLSARN